MKPQSLKQQTLSGDDEIERTSNRKPSLARLGFALIAIFAMLLSAPSGGIAQQIVALVNGEPITAYDVDQRTRLTQISTQKKPSRQDVIQELIDDHLKTQLLRRYSIEGMDKEVEAAFATMAGRMRMSPKQFTEVLAKAGVSAKTMKAKIKADITWSQVIRAKYQSSLQIAETDILAKLEANKVVDDKAAYDYTLRPIVFIVPRGAPDSARMARIKEAEALRARFTDCENGVRFARGLRDVAVRAPVTRNSADLPPALREILEKTEIGKLTAPEPTTQGVEVYAVCSKKQSASETLGKRKARDDLFASQFEIHSKRYLKELRSQAMIEYK